MIPFSKEEPITTFTRFVHDWLRLLAQGTFSKAAKSLDEPNSYGQRRGAKQIQAILREYANSETVIISDPGTLAGDGRPSLVELNDGSGYLFDHAIPLNDKWSDLTAQFEFLRRRDGYAVILHDIHML